MPKREAGQLSSKPLAEWLNSKPRGARAALAKELGESPQTITNWIRRGSIPGAHLVRIAARIGTTAENYGVTNALSGHSVERYIDSDPPSEKHGRLVKPLAAQERETLSYLRRPEESFRKVASAFIEACRSIDAEIARGNGRRNSPAPRATKPKRGKGPSGTPS